MDSRERNSLCSGGLLETAQRFPQPAGFHAGRRVAVLREQCGHRRVAGV